MSAAFGQGYIYVHKKTLNEKSSLDFNFSLTGGLTKVADFTLSERPDYTNIINLGADISGGLWAAASSGLFYRAAGNSAWMQKLTGSIQRVNGAVSGTCYYILGSAVYYFNDTSSVLIGKPGSVSTADISSNRTYTVVTNTAGSLYQVNAGFFSRINTLPTGVKASYIGMGAAGSIYLRETASSTNAYRVSSLTATNVFAGYPPGPISGNATELSVPAHGAAMIQVGPGSQPSGYSFKGSTWIIETESRGMAVLAGGPGQQLWSVSALPAKPNTIFTRTGPSNLNLAFWIDDERVRTTKKDNSILIPVSALIYTLAKTLPQGWNITNITLCDPAANSTVSLNAGTAAILVASGEVVHVLVENTLLQTTAVAISSRNTFTETFGTGTVGTVGDTFQGVTS